jgi:hypothetical protein
MDKPVMKREVGVRLYVRSMRMIVFYSTDDALTEFSEFGQIESGDTDNTCRLWVDSRFDFDEVLKYIEEYG